MISIPWWLRIAISLAWGTLRRQLERAGVDKSVIDKIEEILRFIGVLGGASVSHTQLKDRVERVHRECEGIGCKPELKFS